MDGFQHLVLGNGRYRLFALTHRPHYAADDDFGYVVTTPAGDRVRDEPTLATALAWMGARTAHDPAPPPILATGRNRRR
jgi:hypothetical protein